MKVRVYTLAVILAMSILVACASGTATSTPSPAATAEQEATATNPPAETEPVATSGLEAENLVAFDEMGISVGFNYPDGIQQGTSTSVQPVYTNVGPTELPYPQHARILFTAYTNGSEDHTASGIRIYRVEEINALEAGVVENLFAVMEGQADHHTDFPRFNGASALIDAQLAEVNIQNGRGYRYLFTTSFAAEMVNGTGTTLMYQGITDDEKYFVSFLIPVDAPFLSEFIGVPLATTPEEFDAYYQSVNERVNTAAPDEFTPSLNTIDELISSIVIVEH
ncbi:MAG: hypothetical protein J0M11_09385 [Anaerolineae bacterium]|nr:hypothetical protein [Anaerolineae bacterium]